MGYAEIPANIRRGLPLQQAGNKATGSSITELAFHSIHTSRLQKAKSVTHVFGTKRHPCRCGALGVGSG
jgi:hypothetical protein